MEIRMKALAGTLESGDVLVTVGPMETLRVDIDSPVLRQFGPSIEQSVREVLAELNVQSGHIHLSDQGALDCTVRARLRTAVRRGCGGACAGKAESNAEGVRA